MFLESEAHSVQIPSLEKYLDVINILPSESLGDMGGRFGLPSVKCISYAIWSYFLNSSFMNPKLWILLGRTQQG